MDEGEEAGGAGYRPVGDWGRRDMRLPELCRLASMLRLFLTASSERRLVRGAKLGMLCLNSSETHTHTHQLSPLRLPVKGKWLHAVTFPFMRVQGGMLAVIFSHGATAL